MHRLLTPFGDYLCARPPQARSGAVSAVLERLTASEGEPPAILHWNGLTPDGREVVWGAGGLDPLLAADPALAGCAAVSGAAMRRLLSRKAVRAETDVAQALAVLLRGAGPTSVWCEGLIAPLALDAVSSVAPSASAERLSIILTVGPESSDIAPFLSALAGQRLSARAELLLMLDGVSGPEQQRLTAEAEAWSSETKVRVRRYALAGTPPVYLRNVAVGLATGEVVLLADPRATPTGADAVQQLADWAASGGVAAASPRLERRGELLAAGLGVGAGAGDASLRVWSDPALSRLVRSAAAPLPWLFAANRRVWLDSDGLRATASPGLWTSDFAVRGGPAGRSLHVGSVSAEWIGAEPPAGLGASAALDRPLQDAAARAIRVANARPPAAPPELSASRVSGVAYPLDDPARPGARRLLVFADAFGASQAIAFEHGLAGARRAGRASVRLIEEAAFSSDGRSLSTPPCDAAVEAEFVAARPDLVIVSRLGHPTIWSAVKDAAARRGVPILFHIDDDLFDLPLSAGVERYRTARAPRRLATLQDALNTADLTLATTPALAARIRSYADHGRIYALSAGTAGKPSLRRPRSDEGDRVVVGYMGSASHDADLAMVVPALNAVLDACPHVDLELFGSIARQPSADRISRVRTRHAGVDRDYAGFRLKLAGLRWDVGLAPLRNIPFNRTKTPTKWAEYAQAGAAVLASDLEPYAAPAAHGAALVVGDEGWSWALQRIVNDARLRRALVQSADALLDSQFSWCRLQTEIEAAVSQVLSAGPVRGSVPAGA